MNNIIELIKKNEQLFLDNAEALNDEEVEQEDIDEYAGSLYLMLDYDPSEKGEIGQIICYVHDPDFIYYIAQNITETLKLTETVIEDLI